MNRRDLLESRNMHADMALLFAAYLNKFLL
jgi:hypothetical protein